MKLSGSLVILVIYALNVIVDYPLKIEKHIY